MSVNIWEGASPCVLMVCSAGLLRSPTAAEVGREFGWNTRAVGAFPHYALIPVNAQVLSWANKIVCMQEEHKLEILQNFGGLRIEEKIVVLGIEDNFAFREDRLVEVLRQRFAVLDKEIRNGDILR